MNNKHFSGCHTMAVLATRAMSNYVLGAYFPCSGLSNQYLSAWTTVSQRDKKRTRGRCVKEKQLGGWMWALRRVSVHKTHLSSTTTDWLITFTRIIFFLFHAIGFSQEILFYLLWRVFSCSIFLIHSYFFKHFHTQFQPFLEIFRHKIEVFGLWNSKWL